MKKVANCYHEKNYVMNVREAKNEQRKKQPSKALSCTKENNRLRGFFFTFNLSNRGGFHLISIPSLLYETNVFIINFKPVS